MKHRWFRRFLALIVLHVLLLSATASAFASSGITEGAFRISPESDLPEFAALSDAVLNKSAPYSIQVTGPNTVAKGKKITLQAEFQPKNADTSVIWSSEDEKIATVSKKGVVTGKKAGTVKIYAASKVKPSLKTYAKITVVKYAAESVTISGAPEKIDLCKGNTAQLKASASPSKASQEFLWSSNDEKVATVSDKGLVTALQTGSVTITAAAQDGSKKKARVHINIVDTNKPDKNSDLAKINQYYEKVKNSSYGSFEWRTLRGHTCFIAVYKDSDDKSPVTSYYNRRNSYFSGIPDSGLAALYRAEYLVLIWPKHVYVGYYVPFGGSGYKTHTQATLVDLKNQKISQITVVTNQPPQRVYGGGSHYGKYEPEKAMVEIKARLSK